MSDEHTVELEAFIRHAQAGYWNDLDDAIRHAINGTWSIECGNACLMIVKAARMVGPTPWDEVPIDLVFGGVWSALLTIADIPHDVLTEQDIAEAVASFGSWRAADPIDPAVVRAQMQPTIDAMTSDRAYILDSADA